MRTGDKTNTGGIAMVDENKTPGQVRMAQEQRLKRENDGKFLNGPDDLVIYRGQGPVSRFGQDRGAIKRDTVKDYADPDGQLQIVNRVRDGLDKMRLSGQISPDELDAAREFQQAFRACGYDRVKTTNLTGTSGGGSTLEDHMVRTASARNRVHATMELIGGGGSPMWVGLFWVVGHGISLNELGRRESVDVKVWSGFVRAALYLMGQDYAKRIKSRRKTGVSRNV